MTCTIYGLASTRDGVVRYVGQTVRTVHRRFLKHLENARLGVKTHCYNWIREQLAAGHTITVNVLESNARYGESEKHWIRHYAEMGIALTNQTEGGDGTLGWKHNDVSRARMRERRVGQKIKLSPEEITRRTDHIKAVTADPAVRARISAAHLGKKLSTESIAKRTATRRANGGYEFSTTTRAKQSASAVTGWEKRRAGKAAAYVAQ